MKTIEKFAIGAGIVLILYMVMKDDKKDEKPEYEYTRVQKGVRGAVPEPWKRKGSSSGSRNN